MLMASPNFGFVGLEIPQGVGSPDMHRSAMHRGVKSRYARDQRQLIGAAGRMLAIIGPAKGPEGTQSLPVTYMETLRPWSTCITRKPAVSSAASNVKLHPIRSVIRSSLQGCSIFWDSSTNSPSS